MSIVSPSGILAADSVNVDLSQLGGFFPAV